MKIQMNTLVFILILSGAGAHADTSALCNNLSRYACAPGHYKDVSGETKSLPEFQKAISAYQEKSHDFFKQSFAKALDNSENPYFKELATSGLGLTNSPMCQSKAESDIASCRDNTLEGLTQLAQKLTSTSLLPDATTSRMHSLSDAAHILQNQAFQDILNDFGKNSQTELSDPAMEKKIQDKIFPGVKAAMIERLNQLSIPDDQKKMMITKVKSIQFAGSLCNEPSTGGSKVENNVASLVVPNAYYEPTKNTFKFCSGFLLQSNSEFQIAWIIGHELSHSIDPCRISTGPADLALQYKNTGDLSAMEKEFPIKNILSCLRNENSVGAVNFTAPPAMAGANNYSNHLPSGGYGGSAPYGGYNTSSGNYTGNYGGMGVATDASKKKFTFCENDQINESFADWLGFETLPSYMEKNYKLTPEQAREGYANAVRNLCWVSMDTPAANDTHSLIEKRIDRLLLMNPKVRAQMGCAPVPTDGIYCDPDKSIEEITQKPGDIKPGSRVSNPPPSPADYMPFGGSR